MTVASSQSRRFAIHQRRRGNTAVLAMMFLLLFATLTLAMFNMAAVNSSSAHNLSEAARAQSVAESGLRWMNYRIMHMNRPKTTVGNITPSVAASLWPAIRTAIANDFASMTLSSERPTTTGNYYIESSPISVGGSGGTFRIRVERHPLFAGDPMDERYLRISSTGTFNNVSRTVSMDFKIDKKVKFAVVGKVPIQLGRNTVVEGPVGMATANKYPPFLILSDFMHFHSGLKAKLQDWNEFLQDASNVGGVWVKHHNGYDNRISMNNPVESQLAIAHGYTDYNGDAYIDEYDLFLKEFDANGDRALTKSEFSNASGVIYDENLFDLIDGLNGPMFAGDSTRSGYRDGIIDNRDGYAKIRGQISMATTADAWENNLSSQGKTINDMIQGSVAATDPLAPPVKFGANGGDIFDLSPENFEDCALAFKARTGMAAGPSKNESLLKENLTLTKAMANGGTVDERTPYGSTVWQATYRRPVFKNMVFRNVQIPKGLNAVFENCRFEGVTWVEGERNITDSGGNVTTNKDQGMNWAQRRISGDSFSKDKPLLGSGTVTSGTTITQGSKNGNNLRFHNCTFNGPIAGNYATAYTHFANSWEFTGATKFDNQVDDTATIVSPQVNIEMGSFTNPSEAPSKLVGVVVAGNIDIRGTSQVDGSIIITGDGAGNTTLAYFGASDASTDPGSMPEGGYGSLHIRYNPHRALPDGINISIDILPEIGTYQEGK